MSRHKTDTGLRHEAPPPTYAACTDQDNSPHIAVRGTQTCQLGANQ
jgi:hypothetical protein